VKQSPSGHSRKAGQQTRPAPFSILLPDSEQEVAVLNDFDAAYASFEALRHTQDVRMRCAATGERREAPKRAPRRRRTKSEKTRRLRPSALAA